MKTLQRVMQVMTHVNIGCALGMVAWVVWSGFQIVGGHATPPQFRPAPSAAVTHQHHLSHEHGKAQDGAAQPSCCLRVAPHAEPGPASRGVRI